MKNIINLKVNLEHKIFETTKSIILPHKNADFDAIGSSLGISLISKSLSKDSYIIIDDKKYEQDRSIKHIIEDTKDEYKIINSCKYKKIFDKDDLYILTDVNKNYMIPISNLIINDENTFIIDHHKEDKSTMSSMHKYIDLQSSSASEIVSELLFSMKLQIPENIASYLLAGIYLDTNRLTRNVNEDTLSVESRLLEFGADIEKINKLFEEDHESEKRVKDLLANTKLLSDNIALIKANSKDEYTTKELAKTADEGLTNTTASFAIGRLSSDIIGISARSREKIDVGSIMEELGGGGAPTSGATKIESDDIEEVTKKLKKILIQKKYITS